MGAQVSRRTNYAHQSSAGGRGEAAMPEWSTGGDLRSPDVSRVGSNPTLSILYRGGAVEACRAHNPKVTGSKPVLDISTHSSVVERKLSKLEVGGSKPSECIHVKKYLTT